VGVTVRTKPKTKRAPIEAWMTVSCTREPYTLHRDMDSATKERRHSVVHLTEDRPDQRAEVRRLRGALGLALADIDALLLKGTPMSNICFNLKQHQTNPNAKTMGEAQVEWDMAVGRLRLPDIKAALKPRATRRGKKS